MQRGLRPSSANYDQRLSRLRESAAKIGLTDGLEQAQCCNAWLLTKAAKVHTHEHTPLHADNAALYNSTADLDPAHPQSSVTLSSSSAFVFSSSTRLSTSYTCLGGASLLSPAPMEVTSTNRLTPALAAALIRLMLPCRQHTAGLLMLHRKGTAVHTT